MVRKKQLASDDLFEMEPKPEIKIEPEIVIQKPVEVPMEVSIPYVPINRVKPKVESIKVIEVPSGPERMTLYQAYRRSKFSADPSENLLIYNKKRRGYEGKEKTVTVTI